MTLKGLYYPLLNASLDNIALFFATLTLSTAIINPYIHTHTQHIRKLFLLILYTILFVAYVFLVSIQSDHKFFGAVSLVAIAANVVIFGILSLYIYKIINFERLEKFIVFLILLHSGAQFIQILSLILGLGDVDFVYILSGHETFYKTSGGYLMDPYGIGYLFRPNGLSSEPSNHAGLMAILIIMRLCITGYKVEKFTLLGILSIILSFSGAGVLFLVFISILLLIKSGNLPLQIKLFVVLAMLSFALYIGYYVIIFRFYELTSDLSISSRIEALSVFKSVYGLGFTDTGISLVDNGTILFLYTLGGVASLPLVCLIVMQLRINVSSMCMMSILFLSKFTPANPIFWVFIFHVSFFTRKRI